MRITSSILLLAALLVAGCSWFGPTGDDDLIRVERGEEFWIKVGQTATTPDGAALTFRGVISDSRCPEGAMCIVAGEALVEIVTVALEAPGSVTDTLGIGPDPGPHQPEGGAVQLHDLRPPRRVEPPVIDPAAYRAQFVIR